MHLKNIGVENFRVFGEKTEFSFRPITVLTGKNSSGKSSLNKLLLLLKSNFRGTGGTEVLDYRKGFANLFSSKSILAWHNKSEKLTIELDFPFKYFSGNFKILLTYVDNKHGKFEIEHLQINRDGNKFISCYVDTKEAEDAPVMDYFYNYEIDSTEVIKQVFDEVRNPSKPTTSSEEQMDWMLGFSKLPKGKYGYFSEFEDDVNLESWSSFFSAITNTSMFSLEIDSQVVDLANFKEFNSKLDEFFLDGYSFQMDKDRMSKYYGMNVMLSTELSLTFNDKVFRDKISQVFGKDKISRKRTKFLDKINKTLLRDNFKTAVEKMSKTLNDIEYLSPSRGNQNMVLGVESSSSDIEAIVNEFRLTFDMHLQENVEILEYINDSLKLFGINGEIKIEPFKNVATILYVEIDGRQVSLSDIGFGYSQLIPILLKVGLIAMRNQFTPFGKFPTYSESTLILEEPEANLHPDFQSKLADVIVNAGKLFNIQFVVETHSEYFIRKLQYLTAKKDLLPEHSVIYYFYNPNDIPKGEKQVNEISITESGALTDTFGKGFFDEATNIKMELRKINSIQKN